MPLRRFVQRPGIGRACACMCWHFASLPRRKLARIFDSFPLGWLVRRIVMHVNVGATADIFRFYRLQGSHDVYTDIARACAQVCRLQSCRLLVATRQAWSHSTCSGSAREEAKTRYHCLPKNTWPKTHFGIPLINRGTQIYNLG